MRRWPALDVRPHGHDWDLIQGVLTDFDIAAIDDNAADVWRVFFHAPGARDAAADALPRRFPGCTAAIVDVPDEDWAARSQASLRAVRVDNIVVAPPWDIGRAEALPHPGHVAQGFSPAITIVIQPSMGFGTGHHATTRLCLRHLQQIDLRNRTVVDIGTGSGVLAIAASRLGAIHVLAIDDDPDAIESARGNVALNPGAEVKLDVRDLRDDRLPRRGAKREGGVDVVLANLTGALLVAAAPAIQARAAPAARLVLSGFMESEEARVREAFSSCTIERRSQEDEWVCATLLRLP